MSSHGDFLGICQTFRDMDRIIVNEQNSENGMEKVGNRKSGDQVAGNQNIRKSGFNTNVFIRVDSWRIDPSTPLRACLW
jgi:hypothetical protein